jgi:hypothetical protein
MQLGGVNVEHGEKTIAVTVRHPDLDGSRAPKYLLASTAYYAIDECSETRGAEGSMASGFFVVNSQYPCSR